ncbi:MAG TPA: hypothetical protein PLJ27_26470, partial [Polyangiaceae bacterium]|nr:hypothetical protein [Polyangiaceae bacterium]
MNGKTAPCNDELHSSLREVPEKRTLTRRTTTQMSRFIHRRNELSLLPRTPWFGTAFAFACSA